MPVTIKDIAEKSGYSVPTVSQVLNDKGELYRPETRDKIWEAARALGYRPNAYRWAIRTGRFNAIGLMMSERLGHTSPFVTMFTQLHAELRKRDMHMTVGQVSDDMLADAESMPKIMREWAADGLLIDYISDIPQALLDLLDQFSIPSVFVNVKLEQNAVYPDDFDASQRATKELIELGHRDIAYASFTISEHYSNADRRDGYIQAMRDAGLEPRLLAAAAGEFEKLTQRDAMDYCVNFLSQSDQRPTAIMTYENEVAMPYFTAGLKLGVDVPGDLSIVTINEKLIDIGGFPIHTYRIPAPELAIEGMKMLDQKIDHGAGHCPSVAVPHERLQGRSIAPPKR